MEMTTRSNPSLFSVFEHFADVLFSYQAPLNRAQALCNRIRDSYRFHYVSIYVTKGNMAVELASGVAGEEASPLQMDTNYFTTTKSNLYGEIMSSGVITEHMNFAIQSNAHCIGFLHVSVPNPSTDASVITVSQRTVLSEVGIALGSFMSVRSRVI